MKNNLTLFLLFLFIATQLHSQHREIHGVIVSTDNNITVVQVWGTHQERGYATGYLLAPKIHDIYQNYVKPSFGTFLATAKLLIQNPAHFSIDPDYKTEAEAMVAGMQAAGYGATLDRNDILVANAFLDIANLSVINLNLRFGCSSLLSWGNATAGTNLDGKSVLSRHLDWASSPVIIRNQAMVIHLPSEAGLQPWMMIGFAGQMSVLSGLNQSGVAVMQHVLSDSYGTGSLNKAYEPIWFTLRKSIERNDLDGSGQNNAGDVQFAINSNVNGYADGYIISAITPRHPDNDSLTALIAELAPTDPKITLRYSTYPDSIPGDNIYTANNSIARNNAMSFCTRYNAVRNNMGTGINIGTEENWNIMKNHSSSCAFGWTGNIQFMQFVPEENLLKLATHKSGGVQACQSTPVEFDTQQLFQQISAMNPVLNPERMTLWPNPVAAGTSVTIMLSSSGTLTARISSLDGRLISNNALTNAEIPTKGLSPGVYVVEIATMTRVVGRERLVVVE
jgi:hypothetical protein